ncbi:MAG: hypothetical protein ACREJC_07825 [Tepidisphaeraceae bacterium]
MFETLEERQLLSVSLTAEVSDPSQTPAEPSVDEAVVISDEPWIICEPEGPIEWNQEQPRKTLLSYEITFCTPLPFEWLDAPSDEQHESASDDSMQDFDVSDDDSVGSVL